MEQLVRDSRGQQSTGDCCRDATAEAIRQNAKPILYDTAVRFSAINLPDRELKQSLLRIQMILREVIDGCGGGSVDCAQGMLEKFKNSHTLSGLIACNSSDVELKITLAVGETETIEYDEYDIEITRQTESVYEANIIFELPLL